MTETPPSSGARFRRIRGRWKLPNPRSVFAYAVQFAGGGMATIGVFSMYEPAGFIVGGALLFIFGELADRRQA